MQILARILLPAAFLGPLGAPARAQTSIYAEVGAAVPSGRFSAIASPGAWIAAGAVRRGNPAGLGMGVAVSYARAEHSSGDARSDLTGVTAWTSLAIRPLEAFEFEPWLGMGVQAHARRSSDYPGLDATRAGCTVELGARASAPIGRLHVFVAGRYRWGLGALRSPAFPSDVVITTLGVQLPLVG